MQSASTASLTGPMPSPTLPHSGGGGPGFQGGRLHHRLASSTTHGNATASASTTAFEESTLPPAAQGSSTFAKAVFRPAYWREWTEEAKVASSLAMKDVRAKDAANQRRRMRKSLKPRNTFSTATARGVRAARAPSFGEGKRFAAGDPGYHSLHYGSHTKLQAKASATMGTASREEPGRVVSKAHRGPAATGATVSPASYRIPGGVGEQLLSHVRSAPAFSMGGGPLRGSAALAATVGPGPVYAPRLPPGPSAPMTTGPRTKFNAIDTPGPASLPAPSQGPAFSIGKGLRDPRSKPDPKSALPPSRTPGPAPAGFGYGCSVEEHITYGQCLDGLCSSRGNWETVAARQAQPAASSSTLPRRRKPRGSRRQGRPPVPPHGESSILTAGSSTFDASGSSVLDATAGAGAGAGAGASTASPPPTASAAFGSVLFDNSALSSPLRTSQYKSLLDYSTGPIAAGGGDLSDHSSVATEEDEPPSDAAAFTGGLTRTGKVTPAGPDGGPVMHIPADTEAPFACFPMVCMQCSREVPLRSPIRRIMVANRKVVAQHRALLETTRGGSNADLLRQHPRSGRGGRTRRAASVGTGSRRHRSGGAFDEPPVLYLPGGGYMCSPACLKTFVLSKASPEVAKVTKCRNTRRVALLDAVRRNELDRVSALLVSGAHIDVTGPDAKTPLHIACEMGDPALVDRLLHGAFNVLTFTHCQAHHRKSCRCFNQKPNLNKPDLRGYTPLHCAAATGKIGVVEVLVAAGADSQAEDNKGMAPQDVAGSQDCFAVLRLNSRVAQDGDRLRTMTLRGEALERTARERGHAHLLATVDGSDVTSRSVA